MEWYMSRKRVRLGDEDGKTSGALDPDVEFLLNPSRLAMLDSELVDVARFLAAIEDADGAQAQHRQPHQPHRKQQLADSSRREKEAAGLPQPFPFTPRHGPAPLSFRFAPLPEHQQDHPHAAASAMDTEEDITAAELETNGGGSRASRTTSITASQQTTPLPPAFTRLRCLFHAAEGVTHESPSVRAALAAHDKESPSLKRKSERAWELGLFFGEDADTSEEDEPQPQRKPLVVDDAYYRKMVFQHKIRRSARAMASADASLSRQCLGESLSAFMPSLDACLQASQPALSALEAAQRDRMRKKYEARSSGDGKMGRKGAGDASGGGSQMGQQANHTVLSSKVLDRIKQLEQTIESGLGDLKAKHVSASEKSQHARNLALVKVAKRVRMSIVKRDIIKAQRAFVSSFANALANAKKAATECQKEVKRIYTKEYQRAQRDTPRKAKKLLGEMIIFWKKNDKEEKERRKAEEKELQEKRKLEDEMREAKRQQRKFNFLITQTELYAHFMHNKGKVQLQNKKKHPADTAISSASKITKPLGADSSQQAEILSKISATPAQSAGAGSADGDESDEVLRQRALDFAQQARTQHMARTAEFDEDRRRRVANAQINGASSQDAFDGAFSLANPNLQNTPEIVQPKMLRGNLKPYQLKGLRWLANLYQQGINGILADEMGLGKTVQSISTLAYLAEVENIWGPFLIVTPTSTLHNWAEEVAKFVPDFKILPYWGSQEDRKTLRKFWDPRKLYTDRADFHVMITSYEMVVQDAKHFSRIQWQYMILDEAQAIKSSSSNRWNILLKFNCRNRLLLTGTPIQNSMAELWALLHFIMPQLFDSHTEFNEWFSKDIESHAQDKATKLDFNQLSRLHMILKPFMLRRIKRDVENELGEKIEIQINCHLTPRQQRFYNSLKKKISIEELINSATSSKGQTDHLMNLVMQFRKVCNHPELFQRRPVHAPFVFCALDDSEEITGPVEVLPIVTYRCENLIPLQIPRLVYWDIFRADPNHGSLGHIAALCASRGILSPSYIHSSLDIQSDTGAPSASGATVSSSSLSSSSSSSPSDVAAGSPVSGCFSFARFSDLSVAEVSETMAAPSTAHRWLLALLAEAHAAQHSRSPFAEHEEPLHRLFCITPTGRPELLRVPQELIQDVQEHVVERVDYVATVLELDFVLPNALAPPVFPTCSSRAATTAFSRLQSGNGWDLASSCLERSRDLLRQAPRHVLAAQATSLVAPAGFLGLAQPKHGWTFVRKPSITTMITDSCKMQVLDSMLVRLKKEGHRVLIYSQMTRMLNLLEEYLSYRGYKYFRLDGSCEVSDRRDMVADFQSRDDVFVFLLSTRAGGVGINLTAADTVIFYDSDWNPTVDQQAMDRAHRLGQTRQVTVYRLIAKGTVEERILQRAEEKSRVQKMVITGEVVGSSKDKLGKLGSKEVASLLMDGEVEAKLRQKRSERRDSKRKLREQERMKLAEEKEKRQEEKRMKREQLAQQKAEEKARRQAERKNRPAKSKKKPAASKKAPAAAAAGGGATSGAAANAANTANTATPALASSASADGADGVLGLEASSEMDSRPSAPALPPATLSSSSGAAEESHGGEVGANGHDRLVLTVPLVPVDAHGPKRGKKRAAAEDGSGDGNGNADGLEATGDAPAKPKKAAKKASSKKANGNAHFVAALESAAAASEDGVGEGSEGRDTGAHPSTPGKISLVIKLGSHGAPTTVKTSP